jgi:hypothetical protein
MRRRDRVAVPRITPGRDIEKAAVSDWFPFPRALAIIAVIMAIQFGVLAWMISYHEPLLGRSSDTFRTLNISSRRYGWPTRGAAARVILCESRGCGWTGMNT